jgi:thioredoxin reductase (NADPH)
MVYDVIIVGGGPAGLSAGVYSTRYELKTLLIAEELGGYVNESPLVENYLGIPNTKGYELGKKFTEHAKSSGVEIAQEIVKEIKKQGDLFIIKTDDNSYEAKSLILAMGSKKRHLNVPGEKEFFGLGVSFCATCDGPLFKDKVVAVAGGGDSAKATALLLTEYAKKVYILVRENNFIGKATLIRRVNDNPKIEVLFNTGIKEIKGEQIIKELVLNDGKNLNVDGLFVEIGLIPNTELARNLGIKLDEQKLISVSPAMITNVTGIFGAGDVTNGSDGLRQDITAASEGALAATSAYKFLRQ